MSSRLWEGEVNGIIAWAGFDSDVGRSRLEEAGESRLYHEAVWLDFVTSTK